MANLYTVPGTTRRKRQEAVHIGYKVLLDSLGDAPKMHELHNSESGYND